MTFSEPCNGFMGKSTTNYHITDSVDELTNNHYKSKTIEYYLYPKNWIDVVQWHYVNIIQKPQTVSIKALALKHRTDKPNQDCSDLVELIKNYFLDRYKEMKTQSEATINTESAAWQFNLLNGLEIKENA